MTRGAEERYMGHEFQTLQQRRKEKINKLEQDLKLMEAQQQAFGAADLNKENGKGLLDSIDGARNALDVLRVAYERKLPPQPW
jgi:hypothetical protein